MHAAPLGLAGSHTPSHLSASTGVMKCDDHNDPTVRRNVERGNGSWIPFDAWAQESDRS